ncbi:MAG: TSUP family transporter, partial [Dehalococcoidia bacterium]
MEVLAVIFLFAGLSAFVQASMGFGYSLLFVPLAATLIAPADAVGASIVSSTVIAVFLYAEHTPREPMRPMLPMAVMSVVTVPLGLWLLVIADESALRLMLGGAVL